MVKKKNSPGCNNAGGCCGCPHETCYDEFGNTYSQQIDELTYVIANLPTDLVYNRDDYDVNNDRPEREYRVTIYGFDVFNGTYVVSKDANCSWPVYAFSQSLSYQIEEQPFGDPNCSVVDSGTATIRLLLGPAHPDFFIHSAAIDESAIPQLSTGSHIAVHPYLGTASNPTPSELTLTRQPYPIRCDYQDLELRVVDGSSKPCPVSAVIYSGSTSTVTG